MPLTKEQLLIPRYKVISRIPFLDKWEDELYQVGYIITDDGIRPATNSNGDAVFITNWEDYPNIFQPLPWWSDRKPEDMPAYIKWKIGEPKIQTVGFDFDSDTIWLDGYQHTLGMWITELEPATETEYLAYINQKQQ